MLSRPDTPGSSIRTDILVIGSGPGGAVTASLCAEAGRSVLLVEEGHHHATHLAPHYSSEEILQKYRNAGICLAMGQTKIAYVEGRCVGGGSEVNRGLYHRTPDPILEGWSRDYGVQALSPGDMEPHFSACEETAGVEYLPGPASPISTRLRDGAQALGWRAVEAQRLYRYGAAGDPGRRQSMSETFVPRFLRAGGRLLADTGIDRLTRAGSGWIAHGRHAPEGETARRIEIRADTVFVACGAVQTPALLRRSGVTRNIGNSLRFHPMLKVVAEFPDEVNDPADLDPVHQVKEFEPRFGIGCSVSKRPMLKLAMAGHGALADHVEENWRRMAIYYVQTTGGRASVRNLPLFRDPLVRVRYTPDELHDFAEALKRLAEVLFAAGAVAVYPAVPGYPALRSREDAARLPAVFSGPDGSVTSVHVFSSCPMGESEALCATDSFGRVRSARGLRIADASLLCGPTGVNPQGTVMAVAHRNATHAIETRFR